MFTGFNQEVEYVARTVAMFKARVGLTMHSERRFGGYANFRLPRTAVQGKHLVIGEQAGFQDALAGFGMRYALRSGFLAARSIIEDVDYATLWRRELLPSLKVGVANRFIFATIGDHGSRFVLAHWLTGADARHRLKHLYSDSSWARFLFPIAHWRYRAPLRDRSCDHQQCSCVWCRCAAEEHAVRPH
jgi:flavin-dependent dehydrogenase